MLKPYSDVVVIGGGVSGLTAAYWLQKQGVDVQVLEREKEVGGTMKTVSENGFLVETGPNSALETTPYFKEIVADCRLEDEFIYTNPSGNNRYILREGKLLRLPLDPGSFLTTKLFSFKAKARLLLEPFVGRAGSEESIAQFVERRLGREFLDYAIDPFVAGIFAGRPEALSVRAAFPKLYALEANYGGLIKGMIRGSRERKRREEKAKDRAESFSFKSGMQIFPSAIARRLGTRVVTEASVLSIIPTQGSHTAADSAGARFSVTVAQNDSVTTVLAKSVVLSVPAAAASLLMKPISPTTADILSSIYYPPVASIFAAFRKEDVAGPADGFGFLVPSREQRKILGSLWSSSLFPLRAPEGTVAFTTFVGGGRQPDLVNMEENALCDLALTELKNIMQITGNSVYLRVTRWQHAIPQYELGYLANVEALERCEQRFPGLYFCSNFKGGISVGDCVKSSRETAHRIALSLNDPNHQRNEGAL
ncbi:MAG TPA: protoporphyrinogen oxidase [Bacteroidota bacterium]|nr:protoporphyrinogen oxidase [Bacteroidota bacterium]